MWNKNGRGEVILKTEKFEARVILSIISGKILTKDSEAIKNALDRLTGYGVISDKGAIKVIFDSYPALGSKEMKSAIESIPKTFNQADINEWFTELSSGKFGVAIKDEYLYIPLPSDILNEFENTDPMPEHTRQRPYSHIYRPS